MLCRERCRFGALASLPHKASYGPDSVVLRRLPGNRSSVFAAVELGWSKFTQAGEGDRETEE